MDYIEQQFSQNVLQDAAKKRALRDIDPNFVLQPPPEIIKKLSEILATYKTEKLVSTPQMTESESRQTLDGRGEQSTTQNEGGEQTSLKASNQIDEVVR